MRNEPYLLEETSQEIETPDLLRQPTTMFRLADFCVLPSECSDDARLSGLDPGTGCRLDLTKNQWLSLSRRGEIDVPSRSFEGKHHKWQVAREVYSGTETIRADFAMGWGAALDQVVYAGDAVASNYNTSNLMSRFSVVSAARQLRKGDITQFLRSHHTRL